MFKTKRQDFSTILHSRDYGSARRKAIVYYLASRSPDDPYPGISVNRNHCVQLHQDPDLRKLIKQGILYRVRQGRFTSKTTTLYLNKEALK